MDWNSTSYTTKLLQLIRQYVPEFTKYDSTYANHCWHMDVDFSPLESCKKGWRMDLDTSMSAAKSMYEAILTPHSKNKTKTLVCLPNFFIPGFPKCGSSQLFRFISSHPLAHNPPTKEPHWWTRLHKKYQYKGHPYDKLSILGYLALFKRGAQKSLKYPDSVTVDGSQSTLWEDRHFGTCELPKLIRKIMPKAKFVIIMRHPTSRIYSEYWYFSRLAKKPENQIGPGLFHHCIMQEIEVFKTCLSKHNSTLLCVQLHQEWHDRTHSALADFNSTCSTRLHISIYYAHLLKWMLIFPREQFLFIRLEDMSVDPGGIASAIWKFLELRVPESELANALGKIEDKDESVALKQSYPPMLPQTKLVVDNFLQKYTQTLYKLIGDEKFLWNES